MANDEMKYGKFAYRKLKDLAKAPNNPRTIKDADFDVLVTSIKNNPDFLEARPLILSNRTNDLVIIAGNQRYAAAQHLKLKEVPTVLLENLTEDREREIAIRDNVANGQWDWEKLSANWDKNDLAAWGMDTTPFDDNLDMEKFKRPAFTDETTVPSAKNEKYFYIEYFDNDELFQKLESRRRRWYGNRQHD